MRLQNTVAGIFLKRKIFHGAGPREGTQDAGFRVMARRGQTTLATGATTGAQPQSVDRLIAHIHRAIS